MKEDEIITVVAEALLKVMSGKANRYEIEKGGKVIKVYKVGDVIRLDIKESKQ
jgi:hypothetical protein